MPTEQAIRARSRAPLQQIQIRIGKVEQSIISAALRFFKQGHRPLAAGNKREAAFTAEIAKQCPTTGYLAKYPIRRKPEKATLFGKRYFPDLWISGPNGKPLLAIEVKLAGHHKASFKEALAQAAVYSTQYKAVALLLYDYSPEKSYKLRMRPGNCAETRLSGKLRSIQRVHLLVL
ncbi:MAG: hypothetical protein V9E87_17690 [Gemmatimonadales bacterium]